MNQLSFKYMLNYFCMKLNGGLTDGRRHHVTSKILGLTERTHMHTHIHIHTQLIELEERID